MSEAEKDGAIHDRVHEMTTDRDKDYCCYATNSQYNDKGIFYCIYGKDINIIKDLNDQDKDKLWAMLVEKSILKQKKYY